MPLPILSEPTTQELIALEMTYRNLGQSTTISPSGVSRQQLFIESSNAAAVTAASRDKVATRPPVPACRIGMLGR
jgi:hypothetical protein